MFLEYKKGKEHPSRKGWVLLGAYNVPDIYIVTGLLSSNGIDVFVEGESIANTLGLTVGPIAQKLVYVKSEDYEDAIKLVEVDSSGDT